MKKTVKPPAGSDKIRLKSEENEHETFRWLTGPVGPRGVVAVICAKGLFGSLSKPSNRLTPVRPGPAGVSSPGAVVLPGRRRHHLRRAAQRHHHTHAGRSCGFVRGARARDVASLSERSFLRYWPNEAKIVQKAFKRWLPCLRIAGEDQVPIVAIGRQLDKTCIAACSDEAPKPLSRQSRSPVQIVWTVEPQAGNFRHCPVASVKLVKPLRNAGISWSFRGAAADPA